MLVIALSLSYYVTHERAELVGVVRHVRHRFALPQLLVGGVRLPQLAAPLAGEGTENKRREGVHILDAFT